MHLGTMKRVAILVVAASFLLLAPFAVVAGGQAEKGGAAEGAAAGEGTTEILRESPMLTARVEGGELPPVDQRLPKEPMVVEPLERIGEYGGTWHRTYRDVTDKGRLYWYLCSEPFLRWSYPGYDELVPNVIKDYEITSDAKTMTFYMREGMKWSDGEPLTVEDALFYWNDISMNKELNAVVPRALMIGGEPGRIEEVDEYTFRVRFSQPYGMFLEFLANDYFPEMVAPKHYLQQFHADYANKANIDAALKEGDFNIWTDLFSYYNQYDNPERPTLVAFVPQSFYNQPLVRLERNPYFFKVDTAGQQLPYIDYVEEFKAERETGLMRAIAGKTDIQTRAISTLEDYPLIMENRDKGDFRVVPGSGAGWSFMGFAGAVYFNYFHEDPVMNEIFNDKRFRIALSHGMNRDEINQLLFKGLGVPAQFSARENTPWYEEELATRYIEYDPDRANEILDEMGLEWDRNQEWRLRPDGKPLSWIINTHIGLEPKAYGEATASILKKQWAELGIDVTVKPFSGELWNTRIPAGDWEMICHMAQPGNPGWPPIQRPELFFTYLTWPTAPEWARWFMTNGEEGVEPPADAKEIMDIRDRVMGEPDTDKRNEMVTEAFRIASDNQWIVGTVRIPPMDSWMVVKSNVRNLPQETFMIQPYDFTQVFFAGGKSLATD